MPAPEPTIGEFLQPLWELLLHLSPTEAVLLCLAVWPAVGAVRAAFAWMVNIQEAENGRGDDAEGGGGANEAELAGLTRELAGLRAELQSLRATSSAFSSSSYVGMESSVVQIALPEPPTPPPRSSSPQQPRPCFCAAGPAFPTAAGPPAESSSAPPAAVSTAPRLSAGGNPVEALSVGGARYWRSPSAEAAGAEGASRRGSGSEV